MISSARTRKRWAQLPEMASTESETNVTESQPEPAIALAVSCCGANNSRVSEGAGWSILWTNRWSGAEGCNASAKITRASDTASNLCPTVKVHGLDVK